MFSRKLERFSGVHFVFAETFSTVSLLTKNRYEITVGHAPSRSYCLPFLDAFGRTNVETDQGPRVSPEPDAEEP